MTDSAPDWLTYEQLTAQIYNKLEPGAVVKHNDKIYGQQTRRYRQIDVSIRSRVAGHEIVVIVDAKDRSRAPHVQSIGEFAETMRDVGAMRGVIVCRKRPSNANIEYAMRCGIDICTAIDVKDKNWQEAIQLPVIINLTEYKVFPKVSITLTANLCLNTPDKWYVSTDGGQSGIDMNEFMFNLLSCSAPKTEGVINIGTENKMLYGLFGGETWMPFSLRLKGEIHKRPLFRYFKPTEYQALRNYSNGKTLISNLHLDVPDWNDPTQWSDPTEFQALQAELFVIVDLVVGFPGIPSRMLKVAYVQKSNEIRMP